MARFHYQKILGEDLSRSYGKIFQQAVCLLHCTAAEPSTEYYIASAIGQKGAAQRSALIRQGAETVPSQDTA